MQFVSTNPIVQAKPVVPILPFSPPWGRARPEQSAYFNSTDTLLSQNCMQAQKPAISAALETQKIRRNDDY
jgi:hypothetical protein